MFRKRPPSEPITHELVGIQYEECESGSYVTVALYRRSDGKHDTEVLSGKWSAVDLADFDFGKVMA